MWLFCRELKGSSVSNAMDHIRPNAIDNLPNTIKQTSRVIHQGSR